VADEALALEIGQDSQRLFERTFGRADVAEHQPQIGDLDHVDAQIVEVVVDGGGQLVAREGGVPRRILAAPRSEFGDDGEVGGIGVERLADDLVGDVRAVEVACVDVIYPRLDRGAQHGNGFAVVVWWTEDALPRELHRAIAHAVHGSVGELVGSGGG